MEEFKDAGRVNVQHWTLQPSISIGPKINNTSNKAKNIDCNVII